MTPDDAAFPPLENSGDSTHSMQIMAALPGTVIGSYRLGRQLGEGGMGVVYHAQQLQPIRRDVALKVIKPGMDSKQVIARFESERQALAMMDHANIARVLDAGTTAGGLPYFVMELVDGIPITRYCDAKRLTLRERIELFIPVCQAIQHAHQKGIIHRDIKPSNVLVKQEEGQAAAKVIDFGLAKALGDKLSDATMFTNFGAIVGTLQYMSPEQAELGRKDIDTRSDVYSLGALLYELLTGTTPLEYDATSTSGDLDVLQRIREEEPKPPSLRLRRSVELKAAAAARRSDSLRLPKLLDRELDWIVMKALEKDRVRRYETVNGLARDLQRYLEGEPLEAAPTSTAYRIGKFTRKHRAAMTVAAAFATILVVGVVVSSWMAIRASRAEQVATAVSDFLQKDLLGQASANNQARAGAKPDPDLKVRTALDRAAAGIGTKFAGQPLVEASIRQTIGRAYEDLGVFAEAHLASNPGHRCCIAFAGYSIREVEMFATKHGLHTLRGEKGPLDEGLVLSDLEQTKGYEFNLVIILNCTRGVLPPTGTPPEESFRHGCRLYGAMTRARDELCLSYSGEPTAWLNRESRALSFMRWDDVIALDPGLVAEAPETLRQAEIDAGTSVMQLKGRDFLYTPEARGLSLEAIRKVDELVDGVGLIRNQQRVRWRDLTTLLDDLNKQPRTRQILGPVVHEELRDRLVKISAAGTSREPA